MCRFMCSARWSLRPKQRSQTMHLNCMKRKRTHWFGILHKFCRCKSVKLSSYRLRSRVLSMMPCELIASGKTPFAIGPLARIRLLTWIDGKICREIKIVFALHRMKMIFIAVDFCARESQLALIFMMMSSLLLFYHVIFTYPYGFFDELWGERSWYKLWYNLWPLWVQWTHTQEKRARRRELNYR